MLIQANIKVPCTVLDFPSYERFIQELRANKRDVIGISAIPPNLLKVKEMCRLIREIQPEAKIVVGGHIANISDLGGRIDADYIVQGDGVRWFREYLEEDADAPLNHPEIISGIGARCCGVSLREKPGDVAATLIPSVGCPHGCNFCSTSAMFGGKGKSVDFYRTGDELFHLMLQLEERLRVYSFFVMDENFLSNKKRAMRLLELMKKYGKSWSLYVFSSAAVVKSYKMEDLIRLGVSWVWMGLEGEESQYGKLKGVDTHELVDMLQTHGIRVLGSSIIGLEEHSPDNIEQVIKYAVRHATVFHQFMLYTPVQGTPLYEELSLAGRLRSEDELPSADKHGQFTFAHEHTSISPEQATKYLNDAFRLDFEINGPSVLRMVRVTLNGWRLYKNHPNACVRTRILREGCELSTKSSALVGMAVRYFRNNPAMCAKMRELLRELHNEFGWKSRFWSWFGGWWMSRQIRKEEKRLKLGTAKYEPPTYYEGNEAAVNIHSELPLCPVVTPMSSSVTY